MSLDPAEREQLRATVRALLQDTSSPSRVRSIVADPAGPGFDADLWAQMVQLGMSSIHVAEAHGGAGCGYADLGVVLHELGRALTPSPFIASAVLATGALSLADASVGGPMLEMLVRGESLGAVAIASAAGSYDSTQLTMTWRDVGGTTWLDGTAGYVLDADLADLLILACRNGDGEVAVTAVERRTKGISVERIPTVDETRRLFQVTLDGVSTPSDRLLCPPGPQAEHLLERVLALGTVAVALDAAGVAERGLEVTAEYAKERMQFGKPIGSFQAVKHHCANMAIAVEATGAAARAAALALDGDPAGWPIAADIAASFVGPACSEACALELRVHGGIGFTWEHDTHLRLKRVKLDELLFGSPSWHRRHLADAVFPSIVGA